MEGDTKIYVVQPFVQRPWVRKEQRFTIPNCVANFRWNIQMKIPNTPQISLEMTTFTFSHLSLGWRQHTCMYWCKTKGGSTVFEKRWEMKEITKNYLMDKWKGLPPSQTSRRFTPHAPQSWPHAVSCNTLNFSFIDRASYLGLHTPPWEARFL